MTEEQYKEMLAAMARRVKEHPDFAEAWRDLVQAKMMSGDIDGATDDCIESMRLGPKNVNALIILGNIFTNYKKDDEATLRYYGKAVEVDPKSPDAQCNLGTQGISPGKSSGYKIKLLPSEDFSGYDSSRTTTSRGRGRFPTRSASSGYRSTMRTSPRWRCTRSRRAATEIICRKTPGG